MKPFRLVGTLLALTTLAPVITFADTDVADKCAYTLFNPTPRDQMREWKTDRPGVSPITIDAGHVELDVTAVAYSHVNAEFALSFRMTTDEWTYGSTVIKLGLLNSLDLEVGITLYHQITQDNTFGAFPGFGGGRFTSGQFADTSAGLKWNLWGNDGGKTALSLSGVVNFPTESPGSPDDDYSGGPALEFAAQLPWCLELRINSQVILFKDFRNDLQESYLNLISLNRQIIGNLHGYATFSANLQSGPDQFAVLPVGTPPFATLIRVNDDWDGFASTGLYYRIRNCGELFAGCSFGVHGKLAPDYAPFVGFAVRY